MTQPLLTITNQHSPACGVPPQIAAQPGRYLGYYANEHGEQWLFVRDRDSRTATLYGGDASWQPYTVDDGAVPELILDQLELLWLHACWQASTFYCERPQ